ncbi:uncharacterized protein LOC142361095 [Opisthocomus hoazin]|uniref:uncharacterized protein LOC142361095 n=1 Tax=Opisthocomus hoazin TaxID=30419 RepID=UPI003F53BC20
MLSEKTTEWKKKTPRASTALPPRQEGSRGQGFSCPAPAPAHGPRPPALPGPCFSNRTRAPLPPHTAAPEFGLLRIKEQTTNQPISWHELEQQRWRPLPGFKVESLVSVEEPSEGLDECWSHWNNKAARPTAARSETGLNCWRNSATGGIAVRSSVDSFRSCTIRAVRGSLDDLTLAAAESARVQHVVVPGAVLQHTAGKGTTLRAFRISGVRWSLRTRRVRFQIHGRQERVWCSQERFLAALSEAFLEQGRALQVLCWCLSTLH